MDIISADLTAMLDGADRAFGLKYDEYKKALDNMRTECGRRQSEISNLLRLLEAQKGIIRDPVLNQRFRALLSSALCTSHSVPANYAKFVYYANRINAMEHKKYVLKYNAKYCNTLLGKLAVLYAAINNKLESDYVAVGDYYRKQMDDLYASYKNVMATAYAKAESKALAHAANQANLVINQVKSTV